MEFIATTVNTIIITEGVIATAVIMNQNNKDKTGNDNRLRFTKMSLSPPGSFTGNTQD